MTQRPFGAYTVMFLVLAASALAPCTSVQAQDSFQAATPDTSAGQDHVLGMILTGTAAGTLGFLSGAIIGINIDDDQGEYSGLEEGLILGSIFGGLSLPLGVHAGNKSQGHLGKVMTTSIAVGGAGWLIIAKTGNGVFLQTLPLLQLIGCIIVENATTPANTPTEQAPLQPDPSFQVNLTPTRSGIGFFISGSF